MKLSNNGPSALKLKRIWGSQKGNDRCEENRMVNTKKI